MKAASSMKTLKKVKLMKIKLLVVVAGLLGAASLPAHAGVRFGFNFGLPLPPLPLPVIVAPPVAAYPAPIYGYRPGYGYAPGYWGGGYGRVWTGGGWLYGPGRGYGYGYGHYHGSYRRNRLMREAFATSRRGVLTARRRLALFGSPVHAGLGRNRWVGRARLMFALPSFFCMH